MLKRSQNGISTSTRFRRAFPASLVAVIAFIGCVSLNTLAFAKVKPVADITNVGDGIEVHLLGSKRGFRIMRDGRQIFERNMDDGPVSLVLGAKASADGKHYNIAVRFGHDADLYLAFAVIGEVIKESPQYRNTAKGDLYIKAVWESPNRLIIEGEQPNALIFHPESGTWEMLRDIIPAPPQSGFLKNLERTVAKAAKDTEKTVANAAKDTEKAIAKAAKDTEKTVAKAARDIGLTSSLSDADARSIVREAAKKPVAGAPEGTPPPETASPREKLAFVEATYLKRAVEVVSTFETGGAVDAYLDVTLDFDGQGLTLGCFGWTIGSGDLQPLIKQVPRKLVEQEMPKFGKQFWEACNSPIPKGLQIVRLWQNITIGADGNRKATWRADCKEVESELKALLRSSEMEKVQTDAIVSKNKPAIKASNAWAQAMRGTGGIPTVREYTVFLDTFVQNDGTKKKWTDDVNKLFSGRGNEEPVKTACNWLATGTPGDAQYDQAKQNADMWKREFPEKYSKLFLLSWLIARDSRPQYQRLVLSRRGTLVANNGYVNRTKWHFKQLEEK